MKFINVFINWLDKRAKETPKIVVTICYISIFLIFIFQLLGFTILQTIFVLLGTVTHPFVYPSLKRIYQEGQIYNSKEFDWMELKNEN